MLLISMRRKYVSLNYDYPGQEGGQFPELSGVEGVYPVGGGLQICLKSCKLKMFQYNYSYLSNTTCAGGLGMVTFRIVHAFISYL